MTTTIQARPRQFVNTPSLDRVSKRAFRYLQSGYSVHLRGPAGVGKTTLALHLADLLSRPIMLLFGDDEFKTSDLIGNQSGYTRKKVFDNFIHSVVKVEDEVRQNWVDSRLTLACREGFTLVYDEFNRSRPEVNNVLLSALEEKLLVLPPNSGRSEYIRVSPHFRAILTSNPVEYCGVHSTQDALLDRIITMNIGEPDELTQHEILVQKTDIDRESAGLIVQLVGAFRSQTAARESSGLRSCLMIAKICQEHDIIASPVDSNFRELCQDILLSRSSQNLSESTQILWDTFNRLTQSGDFITLDSSEATKTYLTGDTHLTEDTNPTHTQTAENLALDHEPIDPAAHGLLDDTVTESIPRSEAIVQPNSTQSSDEQNQITSVHFNPESQMPMPSDQEIHPEDDTQLQALPPNQENPAEPDSSLDQDDFWHALDVDIPKAAQAIADQIDSELTVEHLEETVTTGDSEIQGTNRSLEHDYVDGRISSTTFAPGEDISGLSEADQAIADTIEAYNEQSSNSIASVETLELTEAEPEQPTDVIPMENVAVSFAGDSTVPFEQEVYRYLQSSNDTRPSQIESALGISRFQTVNALRSLANRGLIDLQGNHAPRLRNVTISTEPGLHSSSQAHSPKTDNHLSIPSSTAMEFRSPMTGGDFA